jgi:hypothetical protein
VKISAIMLVTILMTLSGGAQLGTRRIPIMPVPPQYAAPDIPAGDPTPDFPLRVHIFTARFGGASSTYQGYGSGLRLHFPMFRTVCRE